MMADRTSIEWTDASWNPVSGCTKVSAGCKNCYAERVFPRAYPSRDSNGAVARKFTDVMLHPERLDQPLRWKKPRRIFVNSMSDLFHEAVPDDFIYRTLAIMALAGQHSFQILTKRPMRMLSMCAGEFFAYEVGRRAGDLLKAGWKHERDTAIPLPNVWLGVSVEDQDAANERIPLLLQTAAAVRFVSYEPALAPVDFSAWLPGPIMVCGAKEPMPAESARALRALGNAAFRHIGGKMLDWIIAGGESGPHARPAHPDWFRSVRDQCISAGVPFFFKQWGEWSSQSVDGRADLESTYIICPCGASFGKYDGAVGKKHSGSSHHPIGAWYAIRKIGKKAAGRLLDGRAWNEFPEARC